MKKLVFCLVMLAPAILLAQHAAGTFAGSDYILYGETEIVLKDSTKVLCQDKIDGAEIGKTNLDYKDVAYIRLIKTSLKGHASHNGSIYKYILIKDKPRLVKVIVESPKLSFYQERPRMKGGGKNAIGVLQSFGETYKVFMIKDGSEKVVEVVWKKNFKNMDKLFPDCPELMKYAEDKKLRKDLTYDLICEIYNGHCGKEVSSE